jgi:multicomponent K+:H+ antiporter subunit E
MMRRVLPHPILSLGLVPVWLLLKNSMAPGQAMLALVLAVLIPLLTHRFWPESSPRWRPLLTLRLTGRLLWDILIANLMVARLVLGPQGGLKPAFVRVPVALENPLALTMLAGAISLTPGTVSVDVRPDDGCILMHSLHVEDVQTMVTDIKERYERPLKEIFQC